MAFDCWTTVFTKNMTANVHLLIVHGELYLRYSNVANINPKSNSGGARKKLGCLWAS